MREYDGHESLTQCAGHNDVFPHRRFYDTIGALRVGVRPGLRPRGRRFRQAYFGSGFTVLTANSSGEKSGFFLKAANNVQQLSQLL